MQFKANSNAFDMYSVIKERIDGANQDIEKIIKPSVSVDIKAVQKTTSLGPEKKKSENQADKRDNIYLRLIEINNGILNRVVENQEKHEHSVGNVCEEGGELRGERLKMLQASAALFANDLSNCINQYNVDIRGMYLDKQIGADDLKEPIGDFAYDMLSRSSAFNTEQEELAVKVIKQCQEDRKKNIIKASTFAVLSSLTFFKGDKFFNALSGQVISKFGFTKDRFNLGGRLAFAAKAALTLYTLAALANVVNATRDIALRDKLNQIISDKPAWLGELDAKIERV